MIYKLYNRTHLGGCIRNRNIRNCPFEGYCYSYIKSNTNTETKHQNRTWKYGEFDEELMNY